MVGQHATGTELADDCWQFTGERVDIAPTLIILSVFQNGEVDARILLTKPFEPFVVASVARNEDAARTVDEVGSP